MLYNNNIQDCKGFQTLEKQRPEGKCDRAGGKRKNKKSMNKE